MTRPSVGFNILGPARSIVVAGALSMTLLVGLRPVMAQELPSVKLVTAPVVTPQNAIQYYNTLPMTHTQGLAAWTSRPPEIQELARSLGAGRYSAANFAKIVYEYIRNNIATEFRFGLSKGARGALIDQSGTSFDQAHLMVELLRQGAVVGNYSTTVNYAVGTLSLSGAQFQAWTGFSDAAAACQYFADGGMPVAVNSPTATVCPTTPNTAITSVTMLHVWVVADGVLYDPSYKILISKTGIDLATAMNCKPGGVTTCGSSLLATSLVPATTQTCGIAGVNCVTNVNQSGIESQLKTYATALQSYIQNYNTTNGTYMAIEDVVGGLIIDTSQSPTTGSLLPASAYASATYTWTGDIPDPFRTKLTVQYDLINQLLFADEIAGNRIRIWGYADYSSTGSTTGHFTLYSEYRPLVGSALAGQIGDVTTVTLTVNHPYAAAAIPGGNSGTFADEIQTNQEINLLNDCAFGITGCDSSKWHTGVITIVNGFGDQAPSTVTHFADLQRRDKTNGLPIENPTSPLHVKLQTTNPNKTSGQCVGSPVVPVNPMDWNPCYEQQESTTAATWLAEVSRARTIAGAINVAAVQNHHTLGIAFSGDFITGNETNLNVQSMMSVNSRTAVSNDRTAAFMGIAASMNRLEGGVFEQAYSPFDGGAGLSAMVLSNANHVSFLDVTSANVGTVTTYFNNTPSSNWPAIYTSTMTSYATANPSFRMIVPMNGDAGTFTLPNATLNIGGTGIAAFGANNDRVAYLETVWPLLVKGSGGPPTDDPANQAEQSVKVSDYATKSRKLFGVDLSSGDLKLTPKPDLITGTGEFPYSLSYQRVYSAGAIGSTDVTIQGVHYPIQTESDPAGIGGGWTHTLSIKAQIESDAFAGMGRDSGVAASSIITGMFVQRWLSLGTVDIRSRLANIFATHWLINSLNRNTVVVSRPPSRQIFAKLPDLTFDPGPGSADKLTQTGLQTLDGFNGGWVWNAVGVTINLTANDGSKLVFQQFLPTGGASGLGPWPYTSTYLFVPTTWTFPSGVLLSFTYATDGWTSAWQQACLAGVSNNLGRSLTFNDPCATSIGAQSVHDDSGRLVTLAGPYPLYLSNVVGPDGGITGYAYTFPASTPAMPRPNAGISAWYTPGDLTNPFITIGYDSLFRVSSIMDNSLPNHFTTQYFINDLYGTQNQKRAEVVDPLGAVTTTYFDHWSNKVQVIDPLGSVTSYMYDSARRMSQTNYPEQNFDTYTYDVRSNRLSATHHPKPASSLTAPPPELTSYMEGPTVTACTWPATCNQPKTATDANGNVTSYDYLYENTAPGTGQLERVTRATVTAQSGGISGTGQTDYCYSSFAGTSGTVSLLTANILKIDGTTNRVKSFTYNTLANHFTLLSAVTDPATTYNPPGSVGGGCTTGSKSGALALTTAFTFDSVGNAATVDGPIVGIGDTTTYRFDAARRLTTVIPPTVSNSFTRYCYDADGQLVSTNRYRPTSPAPSDPNSATATGLTASGQCAIPYPGLTWQSDIRGYFPTGDLKSVIDAGGNVALYAYDAAGRQQVAQDPDGRQVATVYDAAGQTVAAWRGGAGWITTDGNQLPSASANALAAATWTPSNYDGSGQLRYAYYQYTPNGNQDFLLDADNNKTDFFYDGLDRLRFTFFPNAATGSNCAAPASDGGIPTCTAAGGTTPTYEQYTYDAAGNRTGLRTRLGDSMVYHFDALSRLDIKTPAGLGVVATGFNLVGEPLLVSEAAGGSHGAHTTQYAYDAADRRLSESNDNHLVSYQYDTLATSMDNAGNRTRTTWPDGYFVTYAYDALNRMQYVRENSTSASELAFYHYDPLSRRDYMCPGGQSATCSTTATNKAAYAYEPDSDLSALTHTLNATTLALTYLHNHSHQLTNIMASDSVYLPGPPSAVTTAYVPNALNEYGSVAGQSSTYDANGNLLTWFPASGKQSYTYDSESRLVTAAVNGSTTATISYDYDGLGRRVNKTVSGVVTQYLLDGDEEIAELDGTGAVLRRYVTGPVIDDRIARVEGSSTFPTVAAHTYYHANHQGSVLATTDATGTLQQQISYDEYGISTTAVTGEQFRYTGRRFDPETGLYYYRARYYSPQLGRFLQTDPVGYGPDLDLYTYVGNDPTDKTDPSGLCLWDFCVGEAIGVVALGDAIITTIFVGGVVIATAPDSPKTADRSAVDNSQSSQQGAQPAPAAQSSAPMQATEHKSGKRRSVKEKHQKGQERFKRDKHRGEKGDYRRDPWKPEKSQRQKQRDEERKQKQEERDKQKREEEKKLI